MKKIYFFFLLIFSFYSNGHEFNPAHLILNEESSFSYSVKLFYPKQYKYNSPEVLFPSNCSTSKVSKSSKIKNIVESYELVCSEEIKGKNIRFENLDFLTDALLSINFIDGSSFESIAGSRNLEITIPLEQSVYPVAYFNLGFDHLLKGIDHIVFLICLIFLINGFINLVKVVTAFTIAHSITLSLSFLGIVMINQSVIEALIALTIIFVALDAADIKNKQFPWYYAFGFGLLHGFGFSGALSEIGINNNELVLSLLFFNVGIEIAQLAIIPIPFLIIFFFRNSKVFQNIKYLTAIIIGGIGVYWFIERVIGIFL
tara:strand:- start:1718 stop:2662 length:945 start_codon:yes stop_codon:yes gene_type:complete